MSFAYRVVAYTLLFIVYLLFMNGHAPGGLDWASYHAQRIFNAVEYLRLNGYWATYGFSIWSSCTDCALIANNWEGSIYLSGSALMGLWPYIFLNEFGGGEFLRQAGPILDKCVIFISGIFLAEIFIKLIHTHRPDRMEPSGQSKGAIEVLLPNFFVGPLVFALFSSSVWSYLMYRAMWNEIWFFLFFLVSLYFLINERFRLGCIFILIASSMHYMLGFTLAFAYSSFYLLSKFFKEKDFFRNYISSALYLPRRLPWYCLCLIIPTFAHSGMRGLYGYFGSPHGAGSSLLSRIGISGQDPHNGGILGALQFLGGGRISTCIADLSEKGLGGATLIDKIAAFNCVLSIGGLIFVSFASIVGLVWLLKNKPATKILIFPIAIVFLILVSVLQQSFSVHLFGHSYLFAGLFACGITGILIRVSALLGTKSMSVLVIAPIAVAIVLLSIRVSMLANLG
jgi:hypothetical protein